MICRVGDDEWGHKYIEHLKSNGVNVTQAHSTPNESTGIAQISVSRDGENQIVIVPGANGHLSIADVQKAKDLIINADILIGQLETPYETTLEAFKLNKNVKILNAAPSMEDINSILPYCTILCINEIEASIMTNVPVNDIRSAALALDKLLHTGCETIIITLGELGAVYTTRDKQPIHVISDKVKAVDTTGAGDAFVGALATFLNSHKTQPLHQIIGAACHIASLSVTKEGTQTSYPTNCNAFDREYKYIEIKQNI